MDCKKLALSLVGVVAIVGVGCGDAGGTVFPARDNTCAAGESPPCETSEPATSDAERTVVTEDMEPTSQTFVVSVLSLPDVDGDRAAGFNVDNMNSGEGSLAEEATCQEYVADFVGIYDPEHEGVDNGLVGLLDVIEGALGSDVDEALTEQITDGSLLLLVEVSGINSFEYDSEVNVQLALGELPEGEMPTIGADGELEPDQTFATGQLLGDVVTGDIFQGRLRVQTPELTITIDTEEITIPLVINEAEMRFDISSGTRLERGVIGGYVMNQTIVDAATELGYEEVVMNVLENSADIQPSSDDPTICDALSLGITFEATTATRTP